MSAVQGQPQVTLICPPEFRDEFLQRMTGISVPFTLQVQAVPPAADGPRNYTPAVTAERLGWNETTLRRKAGRREIPSTKSGRYLMFSESDIEQIIKMSARTVKPPARRRRRAAA